MTEPLLHFASSPLGPIRDVEQNPRSYGWKPVGLWVSVGDGEDSWPDWCRNADFGLDRLAIRHEIRLVATANILRLETPAAIDAFTEQWEAPAHWSDAEHTRRGHCINWGGIADLHDGIIIAPYCWERRLHIPTTWYYGWDCASGCIWRARAIASVEIMEMAA